MIHNAVLLGGKLVGPRVPDLDPALAVARRLGAVRRRDFAKPIWRRRRQVPRGAGVGDAGAFAVGGLEGLERAIPVDGAEDGLFLFGCRFGAQRQRHRLFLRELDDGGEASVYFCSAPVDEMPAERAFGSGLLADLFQAGEADLMLAGDLETGGRGREKRRKAKEEGKS